MRSGRSAWRRVGAGASLILTLLVGCWNFRVRDASPFHLQKPFNYPRSEVFDAVLSEAHAPSLNLEVKVLEKASGLVRFETINLSPTAMDYYCQYPLVSTGCRQLPTSYSEAAEWDAGGWGVVSITVLVTATGADSSKVDVRSNGITTLTIREVTNVYAVESRGVLEGELIDGVERRLAASS